MDAELEDEEATPATCLVGVLELLAVWSSSKLDQSEMIDSGSSEVNTGAIDSSGGKPTDPVTVGIAKDGASKLVGSTVIVDLKLDGGSLEAVVIMELLAPEEVAIAPGMDTKTGAVEVNQYSYSVEAAPPSESETEPRWPVVWPFQYALFQSTEIYGLTLPYSKPSAARAAFVWSGESTLDLIGRRLEDTGSTKVELVTIGERAYTGPSAGIIGDAVWMRGSRVTGVASPELLAE